MMRGGGTAVRTRELMQTVARKLNLESQSINLTPEYVAVCVGCAGETVTAARDIGPPAINVWRIGELEQLASPEQAPTAPGDIARRLSEIENTPPHYSAATIAACVGMASGA